MNNSNGSQGTASSKVSYSRVREHVAAAGMRQTKKLIDPGFSEFSSVKCLTGASGNMGGGSAKSGLAGTKVGYQRVKGGPVLGK